MSEFFKKNWMFVLGGFVLVLILGWSIYSAVLIHSLSGRLRQVDDNIQGLGQQISATNILVNSVATGQEAINGTISTITDGYKRIDNIERLIIEGNKREAELGNQLAGRIDSVQVGLGKISTTVGSFGQNLDGLAISVQGSSDLIRQGIEIMAGLQGTSTETNR